MKILLVSSSVALLAVLVWSLGVATKQDFDATIFDPDKILARAFEITSRSWEFGTLVEALLELRNPELTVFGDLPFPDGRIPRVAEPLEVEGLWYAKSVIWTNHSDLLVDGEGKEEP
jgi:hypothetical protein